jgi:hypothetical protein
MVWVINNLNQLNDVRVSHFFHDCNLLLNHIELTLLRCHHLFLKLLFVDNFHSIKLLGIDIPDLEYRSELALANLVK